MNHLILFTRYPTPGTTKTRLIPALGAEGAAALHRQMVERMVQEGRFLRDVCAPTRPGEIQRGEIQRGVELHLCFSGGSLSQMQRWLGEDLSYQVQQSGDLGDRLRGALLSLFRRSPSPACSSAQSVVVIGTDCPGISAGLLQRSFQHLETCDVVIGPAFDGGYYLLGLNRYYPDLFEAIAWSSDRVFQQTLHRIQSQGLTWVELEALPDIDRPEDLAHLPPELC